MQRIPRLRPRSFLKIVVCLSILAFFVYGASRPFDLHGDLTDVCRESQLELLRKVRNRYSIGGLSTAIDIIGIIESRERDGCGHELRGSLVDGLCRIRCCGKDLHFETDDDIESSLRIDTNRVR